MKIKEVVALVNGRIITGETQQDYDVACAFASDLMSDVLTIRSENPILLMSGLSNLQAIRTCEMFDIKAMLIVRGKKVTDDMKELAEENDMILVETDFSMFKAAGILYQAGLSPIY